jgi:hypothetical protein
MVRAFLLAVLCLLVVAPVTRAAEETGEAFNNQITAAIKKGVAWLYDQRSPWGTWEAGQEPAGTQADLPDQGQFGELTALTARALLMAGESNRDPRIEQAADFLISSERITGTNAVGFRAQLWPLLEQTPAIRQAMARDRKIILSAMHDSGRTRGLFSYRTDITSGSDIADHDVSFHATMGMQAIAEAGIEVPDDFWRTVQRAWRSQQGRDGTWSDRVGRAATLPAEARQGRPLATTADGVAVLFAVDDELADLRQAGCMPMPGDPFIESGLNWIDSHFDQLRNPYIFGGIPLLNYGLYSVARIGAISGRKFFNQRDWYEDGARMLLASQDQATGSWGNLPDTCFAVLFLSCGRYPVLVSKLQYNAPAPPPLARSGGRPGRPPRGGGAPPRWDGWNLRPRDLASLVGWVGKQVEEPFNWEIVSLKVSADELHDSAVLYMTGNQPLNLTAEDKAKLKLFIEQGGILVGSADCEARGFSDSFRQLGNELFPAYEFRNVPRDSIIYTGQQYRAAKWKEPPSVLELNNGVRDLMLLIASGDPSRYLQLRQVGSRQYLYELMSDILFYSVDQGGTRLKGESYIVLPDPAANVSATAKIARLGYDGNWDPEPGGWVRLAAVMHNQRGVDLHVAAIRPEDGNLDGTFTAAHLTGTANFHFSDAARARIAAYVKDGGTLVIDAAGGSAAFDMAAQAEIKAMFPDSALQVLPPDDPVFSAGESLVSAGYRRFARLRLGQTDRFRVQGAAAGAGMIYYSAEDLTEGLVGQPIDGVYGYQPRTATSLMANIISRSVHR